MPFVWQPDVPGPRQAQDGGKGKGKDKGKGGVKARTKEVAKAKPKEVAKVTVEKLFQLKGPKSMFTAKMRTAPSLPQAQLGSIWGRISPRPVSFSLM